MPHEALFGQIVFLRSMSGPWNQEQAVGAQVVLVANQRLSAMAAERREKDTEQTAEKLHYPLG